MAIIKAVLLIIFWFAVVVLCLVAAFHLFNRLWRRIYLIERKPNETHWLKTPDGWRIALHRFTPADKTQATPVLLCHGLGGNSLFWNFSEDNSFARYLNKRGFDVWAIDLRGAGASTKPALSGAFKASYDFHDHLERDLYKAVEHVKRTSNSRKVHFVGHSMGGMLGYAYMSGPRKNDISRAVVLGSPGKLEWIRGLVKLKPLTKMLPYLPTATLAGATAPLFEWSPSLCKLIGANNENLPLGQVAYQATNLTEQIPSLIARQFLEWADPRASEHPLPFDANMETAKTPTLVIAGGGDRTVPVDSVRAGFEKLGSRNKKFVIVSKEQGYAHDYDHNDLILAKAAPDEIFPLIAGWLEKGK